VSKWITIVGSNLPNIAVIWTNFNYKFTMNGPCSYLCSR